MPFQWIITVKLQTLIYKGIASQKSLVTIKLSDLNPKDTLLSIAEKNNIPIASSCGGEGVCRKCVINGNYLSCLTTLAKAAENTAFQDGPNITVTIDYL